MIICARSLKAALLNIARSCSLFHGKGQNDRKTPLAVWLERAGALAEKEVGREPGTLNRHLSQLQGVLVYVVALIGIKLD